MLLFAPDVSNDMSLGWEDQAMARCEGAARGSLGSKPARERDPFEYRRDVREARNQVGNLLDRRPKLECR